MSETLAFNGPKIILKAGWTCLAAKNFAKIHLHRALLEAYEELCRLGIWDFAVDLRYESEKGSLAKN